MVTSAPSIFRHMINHYAAFSSPPSKPPQAKIAIINSKLYYIPFWDIHLHPCRCPTIMRSISEGNTPHDAQRFVSDSLGDGTFV